MTKADLIQTEIHSACCWGEMKVVLKVEKMVGWMAEKRAGYSDRWMDGKRVDSKALLMEQLTHLVSHLAVMLANLKWKDARRAAR